MLESLEWVTVGVRDVDAATKLWSRVLGVPPAWSGEFAFGGASPSPAPTKCALFQLANTGLVLCDATLRMDGIGVVFGTADAAACARELKTRGVTAGAPLTGLARDTESGAFCKLRGFELPRDAMRGVTAFVVEPPSPRLVAPPAAATVGESAVNAVDHVVLRTRTPDATRALYGDALGLRLARELRTEKWGGAHMQFFRVGGVTFEVVAPLTETPAHVTGVGTPSARPGWNGGVSGDFNDAVHEAQHGGDRLWGLAFRVASADAARARLHDGRIMPASDVRAGRKRGTRVFHLRRFSGGSFGEHATLEMPVLFIEQNARAR